MNINPEILARASSKRPWLVIGGWIVLLVVAIGLSSALLADTLTTDFDFTDEPEAKRAELLIEAVDEPPFFGPQSFNEILVVSSDSIAATDPAFSQYITQLEGAARGLGPDKVADVFVTGPDGQPQISPNGQNQLVTVAMADFDLDVAADDSILLDEAVKGVAAPAGVQTRIFGEATITNDFTTLAEEGLQKGESIGIVV
ncbi:MAG: MMPL family transporter, partial [Acidimicrobiia bacterium]